jgi:hypothetical protein
MRTIISEKRLRAMLEQKLMESSDNELEDLNQRVIAIKQQGLNKSQSFVELHNLTRAYSTSIEGMSKLIDESLVLKTYANIWNHSDTKDEYWAQCYPDTESKSDRPKVTEGMRTNSNPLLKIKNDLKSNTVTSQDILSFLEDTDYGKTIADGQEGFAALFFSKHLGEDFVITDSASKGVDCRTLGSSGITIEVKGSKKDTPQTQFSGTLPKFSSKHYYIFLATDRSYVVRSDILRRFYMLSEYTDDEQEESFYSRNISLDPSVSQGLPGISAMRNFMLTVDPETDTSLGAIKTTSFKDFRNKVNDLADNDPVKILYYKMLSEVESQSESLAATLIQSLLGLGGNDRIDPPDISFLGVKVYLRPVLKGVKQARNIAAVELSTDRQSRSATHFGLDVNYRKFIKKELRKYAQSIKDRYNFSGLNRSVQERLIAFILIQVSERAGLRSQDYIDKALNEFIANTVAEERQNIIKTSAEFKEKLNNINQVFTERGRALLVLYDSGGYKNANKGDQKKLKKAALDSVRTSLDIKQFPRAGSVGLSPQKKMTSEFIQKYGEAALSADDISNLEFPEATFRDYAEMIEEQYYLTVFEVMDELESESTSISASPEFTRLYENIVNDIAIATKKKRKSVKRK